MNTLVVLMFGALVVLFIFYFLVDVHYFLRAVFTILTAKFLRKKIKFFGTSDTFGMVLPSDADLLLTHMNNARLFREFDFCRYDHLSRTNMLEIIWLKNGGGVVSAQTCRYRRPLHMFMLYKISTKPVYMDSKNIYFEHKVISLRDDIVRAIAYVKLAVSLDLDKVIPKHYPDETKPPMPKDLELWLDYIRINSESLKNSKNNVKNKKKAYDLNDKDKKESLENSQDQKERDNEDGDNEVDSSDKLLQESLSENN